MFRGAGHKQLPFEECITAERKQDAAKFPICQYIETIEFIHISEFTGSFFIGGSNSMELIFSSKNDLSANMIIVVDSDLSNVQSMITLEKTPKCAYIGKERMIVAVEMSGIHIYNI